MGLILKGKYGRRMPTAPFGPVGPRIAAGGIGGKTMAPCGHWWHDADSCGRALDKWARPRCCGTRAGGKHFNNNGAKHLVKALAMSFGIE